jgi:hypothetical protein
LLSSYFIKAGENSLSALARCCFLSPKIRISSRFHGQADSSAINLCGKGTQNNPQNRLKTGLFSTKALLTLIAGHSIILLVITPKLACGPICLRGYSPCS